MTLSKDLDCWPEVDAGRGHLAYADHQTPVQLELRTNRTASGRQPGPAPVLPGLLAEFPRPQYAVPMGEPDSAGDVRGLQPACLEPGQRQQVNAWTQVTHGWHSSGNDHPSSTPDLLV